MTLIEHGLSPGVAAAPPEAIVIDVDGTPISGLLAEVRAPRAVLVALHGGGTDSTYFDCPGHPRLSLLRTAQRLGFTVLALDRPGYGSSGPFADQVAPAERRVELMYRALEVHLEHRPLGAGLFLLAHSAGCELALRMAGADSGANLLGLELAGIGRSHQQAAQETIWAPRPPGTRPPGLRELLWHPEELYPPDIVGGASLAAPGPQTEAKTISDWTDQDFPALAGQVRIPVRFTAAEHERVWRADAIELAQIRASFTASPRVLLNVQANCGHNLSVGHAATAYHLALLSFVEECILGIAAD